MPVNQIKLKGFTLIEIIVVITIIAISLSVVLPNIDFHLTNKVKFENYGENILTKLNFSRQVAIIKHLTLRLVITNNEIGFQALNQNKNRATWDWIQKESGLVKTKIPPNISLQTQENAVIEISPNGTFTPFIITVTDISTHKHYIIYADENNQLGILKND